MQQLLNPPPPPPTHTHSLVITTVVYTVVIKCTAGALEHDREEKKNEKQNKNKKLKTLKLHSQQTGPGVHSRLSQCHGIRYFAFLLKLNDRCFMGFLAFIRPVVRWITRQWSFVPTLSPWKARFSLLLVLGKYSYAFSLQPSWRVPHYFRQTSHASPLNMHENLSERVYWFDSISDNIRIIQNISYIVVSI